MFGVFLLLAIVGELAAMVYFAYALPALYRAQPLGKRRFAGFIASTIAISPVAAGMLTIFFLVARVVSEGFAFQFSEWTGFVLSVLGLTWIGSLMCAGIQREFFQDGAAARPPIWAALTATIIVAVPSAILILAGGGAEELILIFLFLAVLTWHAIVMSGTLNRASALRAIRLGKAGRCVKCFYDIRGIVGDVCPECGEAIRKSHLSQRIEADE